MSATDSESCVEQRVEDITDQTESISLEDVHEDVSENAPEDAPESKIPISSLTPEQQTEYYMSNFSHIMFSKAVIDRVVEEIKLMAPQDTVDEAVQFAQTLYKFDYSGVTNIEMPEIALVDNVTGKSINNISLRFKLALMPEDYELNFSVPEKYQKRVNECIVFLKHGAAQFSKHFLTANASTMDDIFKSTGLRFNDLVFDQKTTGQYYNTPKGQQLHISYDYYSTQKEEGTESVDVSSNSAPACDTLTDDTPATE